jgi:hypothetical protein
MLKILLIILITLQNDYKNQKSTLYVLNKYNILYFILIIIQYVVIIEDRNIKNYRRKTYA